MIKRTHLAIAVAVGLLFLPAVEYKWVFASVLLLSALLPDIDSPNSYLGRHVIWRPLQWIFRHRGFLHSFSFCIGISIALAFFLPIAALPFFLGYACHLLADSFTQDGIMPFWPWRRSITGFIRTGGKREYIIFLVFVVIDILLFINLLF